MSDIIHKFTDRISKAFRTENTVNISNHRMVTLLGINEDSYRDCNLINLSYLDNYTEILSTRTSSKRNPLSAVAVYGGSGSNDLNSRTKSAISAAAQNIGREQNFMMCFGAPFSYLEAVDPFGRVYKDNYGLRREETWTPNEPSLRNCNTDSKVYMAYIKVGMVTQSKGKSLVKIGNKEKNDGGRNKESLVSSFALTYHVNDNVQISNEDKRWKKGQVVPFNKFLLNAITRVITTHTSEIISGNNWGSVANSEFVGKDTKSINILKTKINNILGDGSYPFFKFVCSDETTADDSISNMDGDSMIKGLLDRGSSIAREISFVTGGGDVVETIKKVNKDIAKKSQNADGSYDGIIGTVFGSMIPSALDFMKDGTKNIFGGDLVDVLLKGNSIIYPKIWTGSNIVRTITLQLRLYSPYGDWNSVFMNILMPYLILLGIALPRQTYPSFVSFPFSFSLEIPGLISSDMCMIMYLNIRRGGRYDAWSDASFMRGMDISVTITPLKPLFGFPEESMSGNFAMDSYTLGDSVYGNKGNRPGDLTYANELRNLSGSFIMSNNDISDADKKILEKAFSDDKNKFDPSTIKDKNERKAIESLNNALMNKIKG